MTWVLALIIWVEPESPLEFHIGFNTEEACKTVAENPHEFIEQWGLIFGEDMSIDTECHAYPNVQMLGLDNSILL